MESNFNKDLDVFFVLGLLANVLQIANYEENVRQTSNDDLMKAMDVQTRVILDRLESKLDKVLENQAKGVAK